LDTPPISAADGSERSTDRSNRDKASRSGLESKGLTWRSFLIGISSAIVINLWLHYAELVLGGEQGHTALANTSIPVGAFSSLFALVVVNLLVTRLLPGLALRRAELLVIYIMTTVATVLSSSGGLHFLIPTITAAHYFASDTNGWSTLFHRFIPDWLAQTNKDALDKFYKGNAVLPIGEWWTQIAVWMGFLFVFSCATLCLAILLRKQWVENEKLPFPTVVMPLEMTREGTPILRNKLFWEATAATFLLGTLNTLHVNIPNVPGLEVRGLKLIQVFANPPWNALNNTRVTFFPFAIGIGFLLSTEVLFSTWFFYVLTRMQLVLTAATGINEGAPAGVQSMFPYLPYQGAGAFLGLAVAGIWLGRKHFVQLVRKAFPSGGGTMDDESRTYRWAFIGLIVCFFALVGFTMLSGARFFVGFAMVLLILLYLIAATRIRAETGNAWPVGPEIDGFRLMMTAMGTQFYTAADLTALTYVRDATGSQDFRGVCMPHQLDALKMADSTGANYKGVIWAMLMAVAIGVTVSFVTALAIWTKFGALAKTDIWRSYHGLNAFTALENSLRNPQPTDWRGMGGVLAGALVTLALMFLRTRYASWPFHPVGYAMANTWTMSYSWMPFFIAWLAKVLIVRFGGLRLYRRTLPIFLGLIVGDFLHGGLYTLIACFTRINVYPQNW